tara:strand:- start:1522 stop:2304 length:783 start_codon:yes stop_codon:yes gene_type:complete
MGVLNLTPDSFSDGGFFNDPDKALSHCLKMISEGADIIDIGGESTRPGSNPVSIDKELDRTIPIIEKIRSTSNCVISIDSYKSIIVEAALNAGANIVNDISGLTFDNKMAKLLAKHNAPFILMHIKGRPKSMQRNPNYNNLIKEILSFFRKQISTAKSAGIDTSNIILDPGLGFGKKIEHNFEIIRKLPQICAMGFPVLVGPSRKSFIGETLNLPINQRIEGTMASITASIINGARIVRVHDIEETRRTVAITEKIIGFS